MRAGVCTLQQALTVEAASLVKQAVNLARRRGHAQVTPLHVANTMLTSLTGLLRTACLQSHSHPLQCKALELCFNVALNRLPAANSSPMLGHHAHHPSLSNALVAAFKRAQAHQRRGSIENQQQPILAVKVELEQLIISILDDPSVSRVMKEAGFSSTQVKSNVEQAVSLDICEANLPVIKSKEGDNPIVIGGRASPSPSLMGKFGVKGSKAREKDVMCLVENLVDRRKRNTVIVGECLASGEDIIRSLMDKVGRGEGPESLKDVQFLSFPLFSYGHLSKEEVEQQIKNIRILVKICVGRGIVLYLGDLKWVAEYMASEQRSNHNCPVEYMVMELGRLVSGAAESRMIRLLGIATYQTYMKCRTGLPSLENILCLHSLTVPTGGLDLSLSSSSDSKEELRKVSAGDGLDWSHLRVEKTHTGIANSSLFESEAHYSPSITSHHSTTTSISTLPSWLQQHKNKTFIGNDQECLQVRDVCKNWNSIGNSVKHHNRPHSHERTISFSSISPSSSISYDQEYPNLHQAHHPWKEHQHFWMPDAVDGGFESNLRVLKESKQLNSENLNQNMSPKSTSSSNKIEMDYVPRFKEINAGNLKTLCNALENKVSWQQAIIPEIGSTILQCRSGMIRRRGHLKPNETKQDTWLFFQGSDSEGKEKVAMELASLIFGSQTNLISIGFSDFSSPTRSDSSDDFRPKRSRAYSSCTYLERFFAVVSRNPHSVFLLEDIEQLDNYTQLGIRNAIETGRMRNSNGDGVWLCDAIIILSCESLNSRSRASSPIKKRCMDEEASSSVSLDLNLSFENREESLFDNLGLLEFVDGRFVFKSQGDV